MNKITLSLILTTLITTTNAMDIRVAEKRTDETVSIFASCSYVNDKQVTYYECTTSTEHWTVEDPRSLIKTATSIRVRRGTCGQLCHFFHILSESPVRILDLSGCRLSPSELQILSNWIETTTTLIELNLAKNQIDNIGACILIDGLKTNSSLKKLNLAENCIGDEGAMAIFDSLKGNSTLTQLNLEGNNNITPIIVLEFITLPKINVLF